MLARHLIRFWQEKTASWAAIKSSSNVEARAVAGFAWAVKCLGKEKPRAWRGSVCKLWLCQSRSYLPRREKATIPIMNASG